MSDDENVNSHAQNTTTNAPAERIPVRRPRVASVHPLPSDRFPYETHAAILRKFNTLTGGGRTVVPSANVVGDDVPQQAASLNARFMASVGLLTLVDGRWKPTAEAVQYVVALAASPDRAKPVLRSVISNTWFADVVRHALATKPLMQREELEKDLSMAAMTPYNKRSGSMRILLDYLAGAGIVELGDDGVRPGAAAGAISPDVQDEKNLDSPGPITAKLQTDYRPYSAGPVSGELQDQGWWTRSGTGFVVRVEPTVRAVKSLKRHVELLEKEVLELTADSGAPDSG